jgi:hypothetical protein
MKKLSIPKGQRQYYFVIILAIILVAITISIAVITYQSATQPAPITPAVSLSPSPLMQSFTQTTVPLKWNPQASKLLLHREENRTPLSVSDTQAKQRILKLLPAGQNYGTVYSSSDVNIQYVQSLDLFQVETLTINVSAAKNEAENWFKQEGMSQQGICDLPLGFYPNWASANILKQSNFIYNELPAGC